ncbi:MAG: hypothetical protein ACR2RE_11610 [Geminicoccaceae bacterium]
MGRRKRRPGGGGAVSKASFDRCEGTATCASGQPQPSLSSLGTLSKKELLAGFRNLLVEERGRIERRFRTLGHGSVVDLVDLETYRSALASLAAAEADLDGRALAVAAAERDAPA